MEPILWNNYLSILPKKFRKKIEKFNKWEDRQCTLLGKLLLLEGLKKYFLDKDCLDLICYNEWGKPFFKNGPDFNISHSGNITICAICDGINIGVDIEKISAINLDDFESYMSEEQWCLIKQAKDPYSVFFSFWTIKESVIKADGKGLSIPLTEVNLENSMVDLYNKKWHIKEISLHKGFACCIASDIEKPGINIRKINVDSFEFWRTPQI